MFSPLKPISKEISSKAQYMYTSSHLATVLARSWFFVCIHDLAQFCFPVPASFRPCCFCSFPKVLENRGKTNGIIVQSTPECLHLRDGLSKLFKIAQAGQQLDPDNNKQKRSIVPAMIFRKICLMGRQKFSAFSKTPVLPSAPAIYALLQFTIHFWCSFIGELFQHAFWFSDILHLQATFGICDKSSVLPPHFVAL